MTDTFRVEEVLQDPEFQKRVFQQFWDLFVVPEYNKRRQAGKLPDSFVLTEYQVILPPDDSPPIVRFNAAETRFRVTISLKKGIDPKPIEMIQADEILWVGNFELIDDDPDCGWIAMLRVAGHWYGYFDFRRNKHLSKKHAAAAQEFLETARYAYENKHLSAFVDNLFSAAELAAKAQLLSTFSELRASKKHEHVRNKYNLWFSWGNVEAEYCRVLNHLSQLRYPARYLNKELVITDNEVAYMLQVVEKMVNSLA